MPTMSTRLRAFAFGYGCRLAIPLWVLAGAGFKLAERNPKLLPPPVLDPILAAGSAMGLTGAGWLDGAMRLIILAEVVLAAVMLTMPRWARLAAITTLTAFSIVLLGVLVPAIRTGGIDGALKGSCGCFGASGPNPLAMLAIDGVLLVTALVARRSPRAQPVALSFGLPACIVLIIGGLIPLALVPARDAIDIAPDAGATPSTVSAWPPRPEKASPYCIPDFATWTGARLDAQEIALLMDPAPPATINTGTWYVLFYREDCEHCHDLMSEHFAGTLSTPTLAIAIPDTDPAASLEMPCTECQTRTLIKGPEYVLTTPVLLRLENGIVTRIAADHEDREAVARCLAP